MKTKTLPFLFSLTFASYAAMSQSPYSQDRVYTANQVSNTVSVIDPSQNKLLGEIVLGKPFTNVLSPLYKGQALVHGLRYFQPKKLLAVVSIGSNSVTLISTENNKVLKTIYVGRAPHEPTFTPDGKQLWISVRGEAYISVIDVSKMQEVKRVPVADGPGMVSFTQDGKLAYVCSSFTPQVDIINTASFEVVKRIAVTSPFSPNIFTSPDGKWIAMTHKDSGKITVLSTKTMDVSKVVESGAVTNHVTFSVVNNTLLMLATVGAENKVKIYDAQRDFTLIKTIEVGALPHGLWPSPDGKLLYVGLEFEDKVQAIDLQKMQVTSTIQIGQSPQALVYAGHAVTDTENREGLKMLSDTAATQVVMLKSLVKGDKASGRLSVRSIGLADLVEQNFSALKPGRSYTLALSRSTKAPYTADYEINSFKADDSGKYSGQSTGLVNTLTGSTDTQSYLHILLIDNSEKKTILLDNLFNG